MSRPGAATPGAPVLDVRRIGKRFPGVRALHDVGLTLGQGEVLAVIGENGAGKSTLMNILAGVERPDTGEIRLEGRPAAIPNVQAATRCGIALIHQELNLAENLDVGANVFLGREPRRLGLIDGRRIRRESAAVLRRVGLDEAPRTIVADLPIGRRQLVEIAKALSLDAHILIMDEPTSSLSAREAETLFAVVDSLAALGVSIVYVSHRLGEVRRLAHRVVVLRDGENAGELARDEIDHERMVRLMVGRDLDRFYARSTHPPGAPALEVEDLRMPAHPTHPTRPLGFSVRAGEIVGLAGLVGAGRSELLGTLFGITPARGGVIRVAGLSVRIRSPRDAIRHGLALVPEDRRDEGLVVEMTLRENVSLARLHRDARAGLLARGREHALARDTVRRLDIRPPNPRQIVRLLSGGNQQKVVLGKWLALEPRVLLLDEPTRGVDVGAKHEIYAIMEQLAGQGVAILFASSEMEEILGMSDRVLVMHEGGIRGELGRDESCEEAVMQLATGGALA